MKILALISSPRKNGNIDIISDEVLRGASNAGSFVDKIYLDDYNIRPIADVIDKAAEREDARSDDDFSLCFRLVIARYPLGACF